MKLDRADPAPLSPAAATRQRLIRSDAPTRPRALAVLDGRLAGRVWADDAASPSAAIVIEDADGTVYAGGALTRDLVADTLADVATASGDLIFGFADARRRRCAVSCRTEPYWRGEAIDFTDRAAGPDEVELLDPTASGWSTARAGSTASTLSIDGVVRGHASSRSDRSSAGRSTASASPS